LKQTHALDSSSGYGGDEEDINLALTSFETLQFLKHKLTEAEVANRQAQHDAVFAAYEDIAKHYQDQHDYKTTVYFLTKALSVARVAEDPMREAEANEALGLAKEKMGAISQAIEYYETHRDLLVRHGLEVPGESARHVIRAYKALAEEVQRQGDYHSAITYLEKSLQAAQALSDRAAEGVSLKLLGNAYVMVQQHKEAIEYYQMFLRICQETDDKMSEGAACSALASAYEASGDRASSIKYLELFYEIALTTGELTAQREACARLGIIFNSASNFQDSVHYFSKAFEISRSLGDHKAVDMGRVNLGIARGSAKRAQYIKVVNTKLDSLLAWKNRRTPLDDVP
jgi:tetratricopeptide (TPR) repeat protein